MTINPSRAARSRSQVAFLLATLLGGTALLTAAPPDLTSGGVPGDTPTINLGPTGMRGWIYSDKKQAEYTGESRQILVTAVDAGSPADGVLEVGDVILGADGTGANPAAFSADARRGLAAAIAGAESINPATLKLLRWRAGTTNTVQIALRTMGAYTATAPYSCPKSTKILEEGVQHLFTSEDYGRYTFGALPLLAVNNPADLDPLADDYHERVKDNARALVPSAAQMAQMMSDERDSTSMITWQRGHTLIFLAEYYLITNDAVVLPAVEAYAVNIAKNQSLFGTVGHIYAEKNRDGSSNGPMGGVYGVVNSTGLPCFLGLLLAKECGLTNPELDPAIERTSCFFAYYAGKGAIPYGEHEPYIAHESNGKSGLAAVAFALQSNRAHEQNFFAKMATAATGERERGHTGAFFNYLWSPLGANAGGEEAAAAHFSRISWLLDLSRRWDGSFGYDCLNGEGPNNGSEYNNFRMSTAALLLYATPLRALRITGRGHDPLRWLSPQDVSAATAADGYDATTRTTGELITDLGNWSPKVRKNAARELGDRGVSGGELSQITALAVDTSGSSRLGACRALGEIGDASSAPTLAALLTDSDNHVRFMAAESLRYLSTSAKMSVLDDILRAAASTGQPLTPFVEEDPLHFAHGKLAMLLFYSGNAYGPKGILWDDHTGVSRRLLYPAIRAVAKTPAGLARSTLGRTFRNLNYTDTVALADTIVDAIQVRAPADKMFSSGVRQGGIEVLQTHGFAEAVPLSMIYTEDDGRGSSKDWALGILKDFAGSSTTVVPDPDVIGFCKSMLTGSQAAAAQAVLDAIANDPNPTALTPLKRIESVVPDASPLTLLADTTVLRVLATDHAQGDSIFTWRKVYGSGGVTFTPNGTGAATDASIQLDPVPGTYLIEVTMSDSRGLTEVSETAFVTLLDTDGTLPPNDPPTAYPQSVTVAQAAPRTITLGAIDPEGYSLVFNVTAPPTNGTLNGTAPDLVYTPNGLHTGADSFTFEVTDSEGQVDSATVTIAVGSASGFELAVYEPFDYPAGGLHSQGGTTELGLDGVWNAQATAQVVSASLGHGALVTGGGSIGNLSDAQNHFGGSRAVNAAALAGSGLLDDGATLWFSVLVGYDTGGNPTNSRLTLALANSQFNSGNYNYWINDEGAQLGSGVGLVLGRFDGQNGRTIATQFRDAASGDALAGNVYGTWNNGAVYGAGQHGLIVGKITWAATPGDLDTIELFQPGTDLVLPETPISTLTTTVAQANFDTITWSRGDKMVMDEIRFADNYASVLYGTVATAPTDYDNWSANWPGADLADPEADWDSDGWTNEMERNWGLSPSSTSSSHPVTLGTVAGSFSYTRRDASLTALNYIVRTSTDLEHWTVDYGAVQTPGAVDANGVELVNVTLSPHLLGAEELFVQVGVSK